MPNEPTVLILETDEALQGLLRVVLRRGAEHARRRLAARRRISSL